MAVVGHQFIDFYENTGGINTVSSAVRLKTNESRDMQDIDLLPIGGFSKRNGYALLNSSPVGSLACTGLYMARFSTSGGTNLALLVAGSKVYSMPSTLNGTWTDITGSLTITSGNNNIWNFAMLNDIVALGNGTDNSIQINSGGSASALSGGSLPFTNFLFPVEYNGYMFYFVPKVSGVVNYDRGYFSSLNDPATVGANNFIDVSKKQGGDVKGAVDYKTFLYVFKRHGIYQVTFQPTQVDSSGNLFPFVQSPNAIVPGVGTQSHRSIVKFTTPATHATPGQELVFFIDQFGIPRIFDGTTTISFASKIGTSRDTAITSLSSMDNTRLPYSWSVNYPSKSRIVFFLSKANSKQDTAWVLDYTTGFSFSRYKYASAFNVGALFEKNDGTFKPYYGDYSGNVVQSDQGTTDNGSAINDYYVTGDTFLQSPVMNSKWYLLDMRGVNGSTSQNTKVSYYINGGDTPSASDTRSLATSGTLWGAGPPAMTWGISSWAKAGLVQTTFDVNQVSKTMRLKIESNTKLTDTMQIEGFSLAGEVLGTSRA